MRFQNNKEKWIAFVGLLDGKPYEVFTGIADDDEGIMPVSYTHLDVYKRQTSHEARATGASPSGA